MKIEKYIWEILLIIYISIIILTIFDYGKVQPSFVAGYQTTLMTLIAGSIPLILGYKIGKKYVTKENINKNYIWKFFVGIYILIILFFTYFSYINIGTFYDSYIVNDTHIYILLTSSIVPLILGYKLGKQ